MSVIYYSDRNVKLSDKMNVCIYLIFLIFLLFRFQLLSVIKYNQTLPFKHKLDTLKEIHIRTPPLVLKLCSRKRSQWEVLRNEHIAKQF